jgi:hypothetical protein
MNPVQIDVFYPVPEGWGMCSTCEMMLAQADLDQAPAERGLDEYPPEFREEFQRLSSLLITLAERYKANVKIRIWDPRSLQGMVRSIRYWIRRYPTFILDGHTKLTGWDTPKLEQYLQAAVKMSDFEI